MEQEILKRIEDIKEEMKFHSEAQKNFKWGVFTYNE